MKNLVNPKTAEGGVNLKYKKEVKLTPPRPPSEKTTLNKSSHIRVNNGQSSKTN